MRSDNTKYGSTQTIQSRLVDDILAMQSKALRDGQPLSVQHLFATYPAIEADSTSQLAVLYHDYRLCDAADRPAKLASLIANYPQRAAELKRQTEFGAIVESYLGESAGPGRTNGVVAEKSASNSTTTNLPCQPESIGRFQIVRLIGHGGMGSVFLAYDVAMDRQVAIKIPRHFDRLDDHDEALLVKEAQIAGGLDHPGLTDVFEIGRWQDGFYLVSRYANAGDLASWLENHPGPHPPGKVITLFHNVVSAVAYCHERDIVHFDLKPGNILFSSTENSADTCNYFPGGARVTDFGLARIADRNDPGTQTSSVFGTLQYMAPEQIECRKTDLGPHTDVFALGVILHQLLTGKHPFDAPTAIEVFDCIRNRAADPIPKSLGVDATLREICRRCLATSIDQRYPSAVELQQDLEDYQAGRPIARHKTNRWKRILRWSELPQRIPQAAAASLGGNVAVMSAFLGAPLLKLIPGTPIPGTMNELLIDVAKLTVFPHLPLLYFSWRVIQGAERMQWMNLAMTIIFFSLVLFSFLSGESPVRAYNADPFTFVMVHLVVLGTSLSMMLMQFLAIPASLKLRRKRD